MEKKDNKDNSTNHAGGTEGARRATGVPPAAVESAPDSEVTAKKRRRKLTAAYKLKILQKIDELTEPGQIGALLRREGLYSSNVASWRKQRDQGILQVMTPKKRGRKKTKNPMSDKVARLTRENEKLRKKLWQAEQIIEVQKKISEILGIEQNLDEIEGNDS
jgi:transposase